MIGDVPGYPRSVDRRRATASTCASSRPTSSPSASIPTARSPSTRQYDSATADAVDRWKATLGLDEDGKVAQGLVVFVPGDLQADTVSADVGFGVSVGGALLTARMTNRRLPVVVAGDHTVSALAAPGTAGPHRHRAVSARRSPGGSDRGRPLGTAGPRPRPVQSVWTPAPTCACSEQMLAAGGLRPPTGGWSSTTPSTRRPPPRCSPGGSRSTRRSPSTRPTLVVPAGQLRRRARRPRGRRARTSPTARSPSARTRRSSTSLHRRASSPPPLRSATTRSPLGAYDRRRVPRRHRVDRAPWSRSAPWPPSRPALRAQTPTVDITIHVADIPDSVDSFVSIPVTLAGGRPSRSTTPSSCRRQRLVALEEGGYAAGGASITQATATTGGSHARSSPSSRGCTPTASSS